MSDAILDWLGGHDTGLSSKALALTALGRMPANPNYPHDGGDFGRCYRLLKAAPDARKGLEYLGEHGGEVWAALVARWSEIEAAYLKDLPHWDRGDYRRESFSWAIMRSIIDPIEARERSIIKTTFGTIRTK